MVGEQGGTDKRIYIGTRERLEGYPAIIVPPTHVDPWSYAGDPDRHLPALLSLPHAAVEAGLGTLGLNLQLLTPEYGPRVVLSGVLCSVDIECDRKMDQALCLGPSCARCLKVVTYQALWPRVLGQRTARVVVARDPSGRMDDCYLFTTDLSASDAWVITQFAWRWSIEVLFRASKQVMDLEAPQHFCQESVEKLAPWLWSMQSVIMVWYVTVGQTLPEAQELRELMGDWDSEWSLRHMIQVLRRATLNATINPNSADEAELREMVETLKKLANLAA